MAHSGGYGNDNEGYYLFHNIFKNRYKKFLLYVDKGKICHLYFKIVRLSLADIFKSDK